MRSHGKEAKRQQLARFLQTQATDAPTPVRPILIEAPTIQSLKDEGYEVRIAAAEPEDIGILADLDDGEAQISAWEPNRPKGMAGYSTRSIEPKTRASSPCGRALIPQPSPDRPETHTLQAISLWQPYASLIAAKAKPFETRRWAAQSHRIGQRIAIHAALRRPTQTEVAELFDDVADALGFCHWHKRIPYGAVVCTATLIGCHRVTHWNGSKPVLGKRGEIEDDGFGDYSTGRYCWELTDVEVFDPAIPAKGTQGWWTWDNTERKSPDQHRLAAI